jgi:hypothetical protein
MRGIERFLVVAACVMTGVLVVVSIGPPRQNTVPAACAESEGAALAATPISAPSQPAAATFVANPFCLACHLDFDEEELALNHELFGIGCERCHGESLRHRSDEANVTPPEILYPKERINPTCMMCHPRHEIRDTKDHQPILEAGLSIFDEEPLAEDAKKYCTDCHGSKHRMNRRTIRWDKHTGALLKNDN